MYFKVTGYPLSNFIQDISKILAISIICNVCIKKKVSKFKNKGKPRRKKKKGNFQINEKTIIFTNYIHLKLSTEFKEN